MPPAFTAYKFRHMFILVFSIMVIWGIFSQIPSVTDLQFMTGKAVASEIDTTRQTINAIETVETVNSLNPKSTAEKKVGNFFFRLLNENPKGFLLLALFIGAILFVLEVRLSHVKQYGESLF